jgi:hypothetical protein
VLFQPRFEPWFAWTKQFGQVPERYRGKTIAEVYDDVGCSMRTMQYYSGIPEPIEKRFSSAVQIDREATPTHKTTVYHTPHGDLCERWERTLDDTWREVGFPVRDEDDLKKLTWLFRNTTYHFSSEKFSLGDQYVGDRGVPGFWVPKSPYQALAQQWMKLEDLIYALADCPEVVEETMAAIDDSYDTLYPEMIADGRVQVVNFGENVHEQLLSPAYFERYLLPFWEKRAGQLRGAGIFSHVHIDGYFRTMLPYLPRIACDGIEALTPVPQGDMPLEEIKEHCGNKILLDLIPAVYFLETYPRELLMAETEKIVRLFAPNLILGISDELPEAAGEEGIERVRLIANWCRTRA